MSMLAEKRRKETWILNPRSTAWSKDSNKFGQRMLEKMGWTPGKGLGVNEQGIVDSLRVKYKSDLRGLGCDANVEDWTKTQEEFNTLLGELAGGGKDSKIGEKSLEQTSKKIRNRVHYHKFTRGKDLSRYSAKDLESILGLNNLMNSKNIIEEECKNDVNFRKRNLADCANDFLKDQEKGEEEVLSENTCYNVNSVRSQGKKKKKRTMGKSKLTENEESLKDISLDEEAESTEGISSSGKHKKKKK